VGAGISPIHAEPLIHCGDALLARGENGGAEKYYKKAMSDRSFGAGGIQDSDYYSFIPACRLAAINKERGDLEQALVYNKIVLDKDPENKQAVHDKKEIVCDLLKEVL
jgi:tetratricopeptide (TPR) repeat protein